jgi:hypothetical protein
MEREQEGLVMQYLDAHQLQQGLQMCLLVDNV